MRKAFVVLIFMAGLSLLLLLYQWSISHGVIQSNKSDGAPVSVEVSLDITEDKANVTLHYQHLQHDIYEVEIPESATDFTCNYQKNQSCLLNESDHTTKVWNNRQQSFTIQYELVKPEGGRLNNWETMLTHNNKEVFPDAAISLRDYTSTKGSWVAPGTESVHLNEDLVDYYSWEKENLSRSPILRLEKEDLAHWESDGLQVFYPKKQQLSTDIEQELYHLAESYDPAVIFVGNQLNRTDGQSFFRVPNLQPQSIENKLLERNLNTKWGGKQDEWVIDFIVQLFAPLDQKVDQNSDLLAMVRERFSESQLDWMQQELLEGSSSDHLAAEMDRLLSEVYGKPTSFFELNASKRQAVPLFFTEPKAVFWHNDGPLEWRVIEKEGERLYPVAGLAQAAGFELIALNNRDAFVVSTNEQDLRLFTGRKAYVKNQEEIKTGKVIIETVSSELYMKEAFVKELLHLDVVHESSHIRIR
ncbi:hypothetical protein [Thalassobacillus sp. CUG 92003]|uniref:hypothetical protein n=1 Tax=Thalassobacillus sp. CUG 92003 TaxID=2736641 RepID=UPI0015E7DEF8|nr:hypothetical protein [Thalassobacillus sp. CUG 92003]